MDYSGDFFIYLSSLENKNEFEYNKFSAFTNVLNPGVNLKGDYTVALQNLIYKPIVTIINKNDPMYEIRFKIKFKNSNKEIDKLYYPSVDIIGVDINEAINNINIDVVNFLHENKLMDLRENKIFDIKPHYPSVVIRNVLLKEYQDEMVTIEMELSDAIRKFFGLPYFKFDVNEKPYTVKELPYHPLSKVDALYVYTDCIDPSIIGGQRIHLLDIIATKRTFRKPGSITMYKNVSKLNFNSISIKITDNKGKSIDCMDKTNVIVVLHFRKK